MATYEDYLAKKKKQNKKPWSRDRWEKHVIKMRAAVNPGADGVLGTKDDTIEIKTEEPETKTESDPESDPAPEDTRSEKEKKRDVFLSRFQELKG